MQFNDISIDNQLQTATSFELTQVYNPVLKSSNVDSLDLFTAKELSLVNLGMQQENQTQNQYLEARRKGLKTFSNVQSLLNSDDLVDQEWATRDLEAAKRTLASIQPALQVRLNFLRSKLHKQRNNLFPGICSILY